MVPLPPGCYTLKEIAFLNELADERHVRKDLKPIVEKKVGTKRKKLVYKEKGTGTKQKKVERAKKVF